MKMRDYRVLEEFVNACKRLYEGVEASVLMVENILDGLKWSQG